MLNRRGFITSTGFGAFAFAGCAAVHDAGYEYFFIEDKIDW